MIKFLVLTSALLLALVLPAQEAKVKELIEEGIRLHDEGKYPEAIAKYKAALEFDGRSALANYELAFSFFRNQQYDSAIKYSQTVLTLNAGNEHESYIILGNALDLSGQPGAAVKTYEKGLAANPGSHLLHYNLALTEYNQKNYNAAERAARNAISAKPDHASSHLVLSAAMQQTGQRIKAILPLYYFLMLEPNSNRSKPNYAVLKRLLNQGVEKKDEKNINISISASQDDEFGAAELMIGLLSASKLSRDNKNKSELASFAELNESLFNVLGELKKEKTGIWWDVYVATFDKLTNSGNLEAFSYYISQSSDPGEVAKWTGANEQKMNNLLEWLKK